MTDNTSALRRFADKVYGGINMSWIKVLIMAVASAIVTTVFLVVPIFANTSFVNMGATMEAWFFLAIIIMVNCKKPLEAALKTFVFFLVSQPLIYLFQVPFYEGGWGIFMYYRFWILWTAESADSFTGYRFYGNIRYRLFTDGNQQLSEVYFVRALLLCSDHHLCIYLYR